VRSRSRSAKSADWVDGSQIAVMVAIIVVIVIAVGAQRRRD
jgi:hypothetical protein